MDQASKDKVTNSQQAKQLETKGITNFIYAGVAGVSAGVAYKQNMASKIEAERTAKAAVDTTDTISGLTNSELKGTLDAQTAAKLSAEIKGSGTVQRTELTGGFYGDGDKMSSSLTTDNSFELNPLAGENKQVMSLDKLQNGNIEKAIGLDDIKSHHPDFDESKYNLILTTKQTKDSSGNINTVNHFEIEPKNIYKTSSTGTAAGSVAGSTSGSVNGTVNGTINATSTNKSGGALLSLAATLLSSLASLFFGVMWGSLIVAGVQTVKGVRNMHKANVMRRDELMNSLLKNKSESIKESVCYLNYDSSLTESLSELKRFSRFKI